MPRIYISAVKPSASSQFVVDEQASELLERLQKHGFDVFWKKEWRDYEIIEQEIAACDALLAIVDSIWQTSTWMASEVTWANGDGGAIATTNPRMRPIPIFLYPVLEPQEWNWLKDYPGPYLLERDVDKSIFVIRNYFRDKST